MSLNRTVLVPLGSLNFALCVLSGAQLVFTSDTLAWLGALGATGAFAAYTVMILCWPATTRTSARMYRVQVPSIIGASIAALDALVMHARGGDTEMWALAVALTGLAITFWYTWIYGNYKRTKSQFLEIGNRFPTVPLETLDGAAVTSTNFAGSRTLIVFFRANWCTLCMAQLRELRNRADRLAGASVQVKFVSNQPVQKSRELARRLNLPSGFEILYDRDLRAARALMIVDEGGTPAAMTGFPRDTVMATVIGLDEQSRVIYVDEPNHYRQRPHPDSYLSVFDGQTAPVTNDWMLPACEIGEHKSITAEESEFCENC